MGQRNAGLRRVRAGDSTRDALLPWSARVVSLGSDLVRAQSRSGRAARAAVRGDRRRARPGRRRRSCTKASRRRSRSSTPGSSTISSAGSPARGRTYTISASRRAAATCARSAPRASSASPCWRSCSPRRRRCDRGSARRRSSSSTTCSPSSTETGALRLRDALAYGSDRRHRDRSGRVPERACAGALGHARRGPLMDRIGDEIARELARSGSRDALPLAALTAAWPEVVGDTVARRAWPLRIARDGTLHVATASATWAHELDLLGAEILERLAARLGDDAPLQAALRGGPDPGAGRLPRTASPAMPSARRRRADGGRVGGLRCGGRDRRSGPPRARRESGSSEPRQGPVRPLVLVDFTRPAIWRFAGLF